MGRLKIVSYVVNATPYATRFTCISLMLMVGDLASYVKEVGGEIGHLEESCRELEAKLESAL